MGEELLNVSRGLETGLPDERATKIAKQVSGFLTGEVNAERLSKYAVGKDTQGLSLLKLKEFKEAGMKGYQEAGLGP